MPRLNLAIGVEVLGEPCQTRTRSFSTSVSPSRRELQVYVLKPANGTNGLPSERLQFLRDMLVPGARTPSTQ